MELDEEINKGQLLIPPQELPFQESIISPSCTDLQHQDRLPAQMLPEYVSVGYGRPTISNPHRKISRQPIEQECNDIQQQLDQMAKHQELREKVEDFILAFNKDPKTALAGLKPKKVAKKLFETPGLDKDVLGQYFGRPGAVEVFQIYCSKIDFKGVEVDISLRMLLSRFKLRGEEQQIDRILRIFAKIWTQDNPARGCPADDIHVLCYSLIMLNTDAHSSNIENKMTLEQFVRSTGAVVPSVSRAFLEEMYSRIVDEKFETKIDEIEMIYGRLNLLNNTSIRQNVDAVKELTKGDVVYKYCRNGTLVQRVLFLQDDKVCWRALTDTEEDYRFMLIDEIQDLYLGSVSQNIRQYHVQPEFDSLCFSFVSLGRTLDLRAKDRLSRSKWVTYISKRIIQRREKDRKIFELKYNNACPKHKLQEIWMTDIIPLWDRHWNYKEKDNVHSDSDQQRYCLGCLPFLCFGRKIKLAQDLQVTDTAESLTFPIKSQLLNKMWRMGLPEKTRRVLWGLAAGNKIEMTKELYQMYRKQATRKKKLSRILDKENPIDHLVQAENIEKELSGAVIMMLKIFSMMRPDVTILPAMIKIARHILLHIPKEEDAFILFSNVMHTQHLMAFCRSNMNEVWIRVKFFDRLLEMKTPLVFRHFQALDLSSDLFLINWMLSLYASAIHDEEIMARILDCFFLEGEIYLFKVGICLVQYRQLELRTSTFEEAMRRLTCFDEIKEAVFFKSIEECDIREGEFDKHVSKRQIALKNTVVQEMLL